MAPKKDYEDYTKFINDSYQDDKVTMLEKTVKEWPKTSNVRSRQHLLSPLKAQTTHEVMVTAGSDRKRNDKPFRTNSFMSDAERKLGSTFTNFNVRPAILETRISSANDFMKLSDGFKQALMQDKHDAKLVIPISGYAGHRRGDRSQNFFGKSFRESTFQSKKFQRELTF